jgi:hypothetical protein
MKIRPSDKRLHISRISIEFADHGDMYDIHDLKLQIHCTNPCAIDSSIPLTKLETAKLGEALILIQQRLNTQVEIPRDALED